MPWRVLITEHIHPIGIEALKSSGEAELVVPPNSSTGALKAAIADVDAVIVRHAPLTAEVIAAGSRLKVISKHGVGTDNIDIAAATRQGVVVCNTPDANSNGVANLALALMLAVSRSIVQFDACTRAGLWTGRDDTLGRELDGKTLGVFGLGRIGRRVAQMCRRAFEMEVLAYDPFISREAMASMGVTKRESLEELLPEADYLTVHAPLIPSTRGALGTRQFDLMKRTAYLVNCSRGPIVNEAALIAALQEGKIAGAGLDVYEVEPPSKDNPLFKMQNVVVLPHAGAATHESMERMATGAVSNALAVLRGESPASILNREALPGG